MSGCALPHRNETAEATDTRGTLDHWEEHARRWAGVRPPLRPSDEDLEIFAKSLEEHRKMLEPGCADLLILGVTPELRALARGLGWNVTSVDRCERMIRALAGRRVPGGERIIRGEWLRMPVESSSVDVILGDGCFNTLSYPEGQEKLCLQARRIVKDSGVWITRCFVQAAEPEKPEDVFADLTAGRIGNFHVLKWRLTMAMQKSEVEGVELGEVWEVLEKNYGGAPGGAEKFGWPIEETATIDSYRNLTARYHFPAMENQARLFRKAGFEVVRATLPGYELGTRCPIFELRPR